MEQIKPSITFHVHTKKLLRWKINEEDPRIPLIEKSGFGWVRYIRDFNLNKDLLTAFYSIFCKKTQTFRTGSGKYMISLEDVICLTGLSVDGRPILWKEEKNAREVCMKYLGKDPGEFFCNVTTISLDWLLRTFSKLEENPSEEEVKFSSRAYILYALGTIVFPDASGKNVNSLLLSFLEDFDCINNFAWGAGMLAFLMTSLCKEITGRNNVDISGNAALLMFWIYERFPQFRPEALPSVSQESRVIPLMGQWTMLIGKSSKNAHAKNRFGEYKTLLQSGNLIYSPISNVEFPAALSFLERQVPLSLTETFLLYGSKIYIYRATLCSNQFDGVTSCASTPLLPSAFKLKGKKKQRRGPQINIDWNSENKDAVEIWEKRWENLAGNLVPVRSSCLGEGENSERMEEEEVREEEEEAEIAVGVKFRGEEEELFQSPEIPGGAEGREEEEWMGQPTRREEDVHRPKGNKRGKRLPVRPGQLRRSLRIQMQ